MTKIAYSYIRMSTEVQLKGDSKRRQLELSQKYAREHNLQLADDRQLEDIGVSAFRGANIETGALGGFLAAAKAGKIPAGSFLLVESLDRLSRMNVREALAVFLSILNAGVNIVTLADNKVYFASADASSSLETDLMMSLIIMSRAHEESKTKSQRIAAAWSAKRASASAKPITSICPAWLRLSPEKSHYEIIEERAQIVRRILEECAAGMGAYAITRRLNQENTPTFGRSKSWCTSYVTAIFTNRAIIGEFQPHQMIAGKRQPVGGPIAKYFPAIADENLFFRVAGGRRRSSGSGGRRGAFISNLFSKIAMCAYCKLPMRFENKGSGPKGGKYLVCDSGRRGSGCPSTSWKYSDFETSFLAFVKEVDLEAIMRTNADAAAADELANSIKAYEGRIADLEKRREQVFQLLSSVNSTDFVASKLNDLETQLGSLRAELKAVEEAQLKQNYEIRTQANDKDQIKSLIERLQDHSTADVAKLRAQVALRLRTIITSLVVATKGGLPTVAKAQASLIGQEIEDADREALNHHFDDMKSRPHVARRYFAVSFKDNEVRGVYPSDANPMKFEEQIIGDGESIKRIPKPL